MGDINHSHEFVIPSGSVAPFATDTVEGPFSRREQILKWKLMLYMHETGIVEI
jgi:hypothetical protein